MAAGIFHRGVKSDTRRIRVETHRPHKLQSRLRVGWPGERNSAVLALRKNLKLKIAVIQQIRIAAPVLLILITFGQHPQLVAAVVKPFGVGRRKVCSSIFSVYEKKSMVVKDDLHEPAAVLWHKDQFYPGVGNLLRLPSHVFDWLDAATNRLASRSVLRRSGSETGRSHCQLQKHRR